MMDLDINEWHEFVPRPDDRTCFVPGCGRKHDHRVHQERVDIHVPVPR